MIGARTCVVVVLSGALSLPVMAQRPAGQGTGRRVPQQQGQHNNNQGQRPGRKMGDWLREHRNLPLAEQEKALENDPNFRKLPPNRQAELKDRLRKFNSLPPEQQERALSRMEFMASLSPEQRKQIHDAQQQLQGLPNDRKIMVHKALRHLRQMTPQERQQEFQSEQFKSTFSDQEQKIVKQLADAIPPETPEQQSKPPEQQPK